MAKRRPKPEVEENRQLAALGRMLQDAVACQAMGERPEVLNHRGYGFSFRLSLGSLNVADFLRRYVGQVHVFGPLTLDIPANLHWKDDVTDARATLTFTHPIQATFRRWLKLHIEVTRIVLRASGITASLRWTPLGLVAVEKDVTFPFDYSSPN